MKKITLFFVSVLCTLNVVNAQMTIFDFDGTTPSFSSWSDTFVSVVNPVIDGVNGSANVGFYTHNNIWSNISIDVTIDPAVYKSVEMMVYAPNGGVVTIATLDASWAALDWLPTSIAAGGHGWVKLAFNLTNSALISHIGVYLEFGTDATTPQATAYYDNLVFNTFTLGTNSNQLRDNSIKVYPNPFVEDFKVDTVKFNEPIRVTIFDIMGRKVEAKESLLTTTTLSMGSSLKAGLYMVKVEGINSNFSKSFKILKK